MFGRHCRESFDLELKNSFLIYLIDICVALTGLRMEGSNFCGKIVQSMESLQSHISQQGLSFSGTWQLQIIYLFYLVACTGFCLALNIGSKRGVSLIYGGWILIRSSKNQLSYIINILKSQKSILWLINWCKNQITQLFFTHHLN